MSFESREEALKELSDQVKDYDVVYVHSEASDREHLPGKDCWCHPMPMFGNEIRKYYDS